MGIRFALSMAICSTLASAAAFGEPTESPRKREHPTQLNCGPMNSPPPPKDDRTLRLRKAEVDESQRATDTTRTVRRRS